MSKWINYRMDGRLVANPFLTAPIPQGGKGEFYFGDNNVYLGGAVWKTEYQLAKQRMKQYLPLQPPHQYNSTRVARFFYS